MSNIMVYLFDIYCGLFHDFCGKTMYIRYLTVDIYGKQLSNANLHTFSPFLILPNQIMYEDWWRTHMWKTLVCPHHITDMRGLDL